VQSVGVYSNKDIVRRACLVLQHLFVDFLEQLSADTVPIVTSESTMKHCYDVVLKNQDYTLGKSLESFLYAMYYASPQPTLSYCGFTKVHPHDTDSFLRVAVVSEEESRGYVKLCLTHCAKAAEKVFADMLKQNFFSE